MAIVVEEENSQSGGGWGGFIVWGLVFVVVAVAVYYIFFRRPDLVEIHTPANFEDSVQLSRVHLNPDEIVNNPLFSSLQRYAEPLQPTAANRPNPFLGSF